LLPSIDTVRHELGLIFANSGDVLSDACTGNAVIGINYVTVNPSICCAATDRRLWT